ncbi:MAG TPA: HlyD family efflux transporter periplasmic adaptor subunit [Woeseiaceae bacterium]|nr:HlyD family efflux transporter periplasmic adaptor subunit [Woeseiaceae bacterium]
MATTSRIFVVLIALVLSACARDDNSRIVGTTASDRISLIAEFSEPITEIAVAEGEQVVAGQVLLRLDTARAEATLAQAKAVADKADAALAELVSGPRAEKIRAARASVDGARQQLSYRSADFKRIQEIREKNLASAEALDTARASLDTAQANFDLFTAQLQELLQGTRVEQLSQAEAEVQLARARVDSARINLDRHTIKAPVDGVTDSRLMELGEQPIPGQAVMIMLSGKQSYARVYVSEDLRVQVRPGDGARVFVDGIDRPLRGKVRWVSSDAAFTPYYALTERDRGRLSYEAKIDIIDDIERLPDGVPLEVELDTGAAAE